MIEKAMNFYDKRKNLIILVREPVELNFIYLYDSLRS